MKKLNQKGFTLIELLVVIGILAILFSIVLIAINPARQFAQANDTKMRSDTLQILNAVHQYAAENSGNLPNNMPAIVAPATTGVAAITLADKNVPATAGNLCLQLVPKYISALPVAPATAGAGGVKGAAITDCANPYATGYNVGIDGAGRVTISATATDVNGGVISITR
jgi:prepilin-type N-terminal cleavage/methylation domain-containing protein